MSIDFDDVVCDELIQQSEIIQASFETVLRKPLLPTSKDPVENARRLFEASFVVVSAGTESDPILNYGNAAALRLWEISWEQLVQTPGRKTAEPMHREERAHFLEEVRTRGYIDDYSGIRIATTGRRFRIHRATVWNLTDDQGNNRGQAATFSDWTFLE